MRPPNSQTAAAHPALTPLADLEQIGQLVLTAEGNILALNGSASRLLGASAAQFIGINARDLVPHNAERFAQMLTQAKHEGFVRDEVVVIQSTQDTGVTVELSLIAAPESGSSELTIHAFFKRIDHDNWQARELEKNEARFREALESAGIGVWDMDIERNETFRSPLHDFHFGYPEPLDNWGYDDFIRHVAPEDQARVADAYLSAMAGGKEYDVKFRVVWPDGSIHWQWSKGRFYLNADGTPKRVAGLTADITRDQQAREKMLLAQRSIDASSEGIVIVDAKAPDMPMVSANPAFYELTGYSESEVIGQNCRFLQQQDTEQQQLMKLRAAISDERDATVLLKNYRKSGQPFWNQLRIAPVKNDAGAVTHYVGLQRDVTRELQLKGDLEFRASHDELTKLRNRKEFRKALDCAIGNASSTELIGVYFLDVDHFKQINDYWDHATGDLLLKEVAQRLESLTEQRVITGRFGGDEFCLAAAGLTGVPEVQEIADDIARELSQPIDIEGHTIEISTSIGISVFPEDARNATTLLKYADDALLQAKRAGRSRAVRFDEKHHAERLAQFSLEGDLKKALKQRELKVFYQAKFNSLTGKTIGFEALLRWIPEHGNPVSPAVFIPTAEQSGLIHDIGRWLISEVFQQISDWRNMGYQLVPVAINISNLQLEATNLADFVLECMHRYDIPGKLVEIELTETLGVYDPAKLSKLIETLRPHGVSFAIDDFGTGHSNLCYLRQYAFDCIKIDRQFVAGLTELTEDAAICRSIVALADIFNMRVIGEGIEDQKTAEFLQRIGCYELQGFLYAKPSKPEEAAKFIAQRPSSSPRTAGQKNAAVHSNASLIHEQLRTDSIRRFGLDQPLNSEGLQTIVDLARTSFGVAHAKFNVVASESTVEKIGSATKTKLSGQEIAYERSQTVCAHTVLGSTVYTVSDLSKHPIHQKNTLVTTDMDLRFYAGVSIYAPDGKVVGTLCLLDHKPRHLNAADYFNLHRFARLIEDWLFQRCVSQSLIDHKLRNERDYHIELSEEWKTASHGGESFGLIAAHCRLEPARWHEHSGYSDKASEVLSKLSPEFGGNAYRLRDNSFRIVFRKTTPATMDTFMQKFLESMVRLFNESPEMTPALLSAHTPFANGTTKDLGKLIEQIRFI